MVAVYTEIVKPLQELQVGPGRLDQLVLIHVLQQSSWSITDRRCTAAVSCTG